MSLHIKNIALHQLSKKEDEIILETRSELLEVSQSTEQLIATLHRTFNNKPSKGFGVLKAESDFKNWLSEYDTGKRTYLDFSITSSHRLLEELNKYPFADTGLIVMAEYQSLATDYLYVGIIPCAMSLKVTEGLNIDPTDYLALESTDIAARIDLSLMNTSNDSNRYLSFINGRVGRKVSDFFLDFLNAEVGLNVKEQNSTLVQAVSDFCTEAKLSRDEELSLKTKVVNYCKEQAKNGDDVVIKELSDEIPCDDFKPFAEFTDENGYELQAEFPASKSITKKLNKFAGAGGGLNITFDACLLGERVLYEPETERLTIVGIPPNLKLMLEQQLKGKKQ